MPEVRFDLADNIYYNNTEIKEVWFNKEMVWELSREIWIEGVEPIYVDYARHYIEVSYDLIRSNIPDRNYGRINKIKTITGTTYRVVSHEDSVGFLRLRLSESPSGIARGTRVSVGYE